MNSSHCFAVLLLTICASTGCDGNHLKAIPIVSKPQQNGSASVRWFQDDDSHYGLRDNEGVELLSPTYDAVQPFAEGLAAVNVGAKWVFPGFPEGGEWGYVNESGVLVIATQFQYVNEFSEGLANVANWSSGEGTMFIDRQGVIQIRIPEGNAGDFREGLAPVYHDRSLKGQDCLTNYIDTSGETKFSVDGYGRGFWDGLAVLVVRDGKSASNEESSYGYIDTTGTVVIQPKFGAALHFSDGLAAVCTNSPPVNGMGDSWGYINPSGDYVIDPIYNEAKPFRDGQAMVHEGGELMLVYDAPCFWQGGTWWLIDAKGVKIGRIAE